MSVLNLHSSSVLDSLGRPKKKKSEYGLDLEPYLQSDLLGDEEEEDPFINPPKPTTARAPGIDVDAVRNASKGQTPVEKQTEKHESSQKTIYQQIDEMYKPQTEATDRYNKHLQDFPERNKPSIWRKIVAAGQAVGNKELGRPGGPDAADRVMYAPFLHDEAEWKEKSQPYYNAANLERQGNIQERTLVSNAIQAETQNRKLEETERHNKAREESEKIRALATKAKSEGYKIDTYGDRIIATRTINGKVETIDLGDSGKMDQRDLEILKGGYQVQAAQARVTSAEGIANTRQSGLYQEPGKPPIYWDAGEQAWFNPGTGEEADPPTANVSKVGTAPRGSGSTGLSESDQIRVQQRKTEHAYQYLPGGRNWIKRNPRVNNPSAYVLQEPPEQGWFESDEAFGRRYDEYNFIKNSIYGTGTDVGAGQNQGQGQGQTQGTGQGQNQPPPAVKPETRQGLGPPTAAPPTAPAPVPQANMSPNMQRGRASQILGPGGAPLPVYGPQEAPTGLGQSLENFGQYLDHDLIKGNEVDVANPNMAIRGRQRPQGVPIPTPTPTPTPNEQAQPVISEGTIIRNPRTGTLMILQGGEWREYRPGPGVQ